VGNPYRRGQGGDSRREKQEDERQRRRPKDKVGGRARKAGQHEEEGGTFYCRGEAPLLESRGEILTLFVEEASTPSQRPAGREQIGGSSPSGPRSTLQGGVLVEESGDHLRGENRLREDHHGTVPRSSWQRGRLGTKKTTLRRENWEEKSQNRGEERASSQRPEGGFRGKGRAKPRNRPGGRQSPTSGRPSTQLSPLGGERSRGVAKGSGPLGSYIIPHKQLNGSPPLVWVGGCGGGVFGGGCGGCGGGVEVLLKKTTGDPYSWASSLTNGICCRQSLLYFYESSSKLEGGSDLFWAGRVQGEGLRSVKFPSL